MRSLFVASLIAAAVAAPVSASASTTTARLRISDLTPLTVRGTGFESHERVLLVAVAGRRSVRTIDASAAGSFTVVFRRLVPRRCQGFAVHASGNRGSRASITFVPPCPPPPRR